MQLKATHLSVPLELATIVYALLLLETCTYPTLLTNKIKDKTGLYIIVMASNYDWLEYASGNTTYEDLFVMPNNKSI